MAIERAAPPSPPSSAAHLDPPGRETEAAREELGDRYRLYQWRKAAADHAAGASAEPVYRMLERGLAEVHASGCLLDFGAGGGALSRRLIASGRFSEVTGADIVAAPVDVDGLRWVQQDLNEPLKVPDGSYDVVVAAEVIEHLENPRALARDWFRVLRPGGSLLFSTPNNESLRALDSLAVQGHFVAFTDSSYPAHITPMLRKDMERVVMEAGFSAPFFRFTNVGGIPKFPDVSWQHMTRGLLKGMRFSDNVLCVAHKPRG